MLKLVIAFEDAENNKMLSLCLVDDSQLLRKAARTAVVQADEEAEQAAHANPEIGHIRRAEALRLRTVLQSLLPGFDSQLTLGDSRRGVLTRQ